MHTFFSDLAENRFPGAFRVGEHDGNISFSIWRMFDPVAPMYTFFTGLAENRSRGGFRDGKHDGNISFSIWRKFDPVAPMYVHFYQRFD